MRKYAKSRRWRREASIVAGGVDSERNPNGPFGKQFCKTRDKILKKTRLLCDVRQTKTFSATYGNSSSWTSIKRHNATRMSSEPFSIHLAQSPNRIGRNKVAII